MSTDINFMGGSAEEFRVRGTDITLSYGKYTVSEKEVLVSISINNDQVTWWIPIEESKKVLNILEKVTKDLKRILKEKKNGH